MAVTREKRDGLRLWYIIAMPAIIYVLAGGVSVCAQDALAPAAGVELIPPGQAAGIAEQVVEVRIVGNQTVKMERILPHIRTRAGRDFVQELVEQDVRRLNQTGYFVDIRVAYQHLPAGRVVIFEVVERPMLHYVKYIGNRKIKRKLLEEETHIKEGDPLDPYRAEEARRALELFYQDHGFGIARVTIAEGNKPGDRGLVFVINEGPKQKILKTTFVGNTIASDARLETQLKAKHGFLWIFGGEYDRRLIEEDRNLLTAYYRGLGFFRATIGTPEITFGDSREWVSVNWVISEGPRYTIRSISINGNTKINTEKLAADLKLLTGKYFNQRELERDIASIEEEYGSIGYIFADIRAEPCFMEEPGQLDLVYEVTEGDQYRVGRITPQITGEYPHTKITTILNRISLQPGDIVDIRELRASKRRLKASGLFEVNPQQGTVPDIVISDPSKAEYLDGPPRPQIARPIDREPDRDDGFRGQSPDYGYDAAGRTSGVRYVDLQVTGRLVETNDGGTR